MIPDSYGDDEAFLVATEIAHNTSTNTWRIRVDPESPVVGPAADLDVATLRAADPERIETEAGYSYRGRLLFSAGVVTLINGQLVLLQRGPDAPSDPGLWQSPAGRCEEPPGTTALRELYEELIILEDDRPVFIEYGDRVAEFEPVYESTLQRRQRDCDPAAWTRYRGSVPPAAGEQLATVELSYGTETHTAEMIAFFDADASTLELRFPIAISVPDPESLQFLDGEFDRTIRRFEPAAVVEMAEDDLVPTDGHLAATLYPKFA